MKQIKVHISGKNGDFSLRADFELPKGTLAIIGPNGAGKTTLLKMLLGVYTPDSGRIEIAGATLFEHKSAINLATEARRIGYMPQNYGLFEHLNVAQNIAFGLKALKLPADQISARVEKWLREFKLSALSKRYPATLSGGEKQRVALARALAIKPRALFLDEPLSALDLGARRRTRAFLADYLAALKLPTIIVTHDPSTARALGDQLLLLEAGQTVFSGTLSQAEQRPPSEFLREFLRP